MIRYALVCDHHHEFEAWFGASGDYDDQVARGLVECPHCNSPQVRKQIMAPAVTGTKAQKSPPTDSAMPSEAQAMMMEVMGKVRDYVQTHFEDVGDNFAREARDIHDLKRCANWSRMACPSHLCPCRSAPRPSSIERPMAWA